MITRRIAYTHNRGSVAVYCPSEEIFHIMQSGGYWDDRPRGFVDEQIRRQISDGIAPDHARRFAHAVAFGGVTEAEAWGIIRDRDCARHGKLHELIDVSELPDRWFRDAWTRSHNGGPVSVSLEKARPIQWGRMRAAARNETQRRDTDLNTWRKPLRIVWHSIERAIRNARDADELRRVWPENLPRHN